MKRKLDEHDVPQVVDDVAKSTETKPTGFAALGLDPRLLQAIAKQQYSEPKLVQSKAIPLALAHKDLLVNSSTGSGKTAAYVLPILHSILRHKTEQKAGKKPTALILVPTRELANQVTAAIRSFSAFCAQDVRIENLTRKEDEKVLRARMLDSPDIVIATPSRASAMVSATVLNLSGLQHLVVDEADLVLSYGHDQDLRSLAALIPKGVQSSLMSATLRADIEVLKELFCQDPMVLDLEDEEKEQAKLDQYIVRCGEDEKFLLAYAIFKLKLVTGKCIIFVADIDRCYRLKLFLEQFGVKSCVLNSELPVNSRIHVVEEFNRNVYDIIIASDETEVVGGEGRRQKRESADLDGPEDANGDTVVTIQNGGSYDKPPKKKRIQSDKEYGVSRGIDFKNVACVLNFDLPTSSKSYTHRVGRTARAGRSGMALSFVIPRNLYRKHKPTSIPSAQYDEEILEKITRHQEKTGQQVQPYDFDMKRLEGFRYRMGDALRSVTGIAVREARSRELKQELLKSEKLKRHFEENPEDLRNLRHDQESRAVRVQPHLKHVPDYLMPSGGKQSLVKGDVGFGKTTENRIRKARMQNRLKSKSKKGKRGDPLKTLRTRKA